MGPRPAPLWRLAAAAVADGLLGIIAWSLAAMWLIVAVLVFLARPLDLLDGLVLALAVLVLGVALHVIYHTVLVGGCGQTLGKMLLGVAVVRRDGAPAGYGRALLRCVGAGSACSRSGSGGCSCCSLATGAGSPTSWLAPGRSLPHPDPLSSRSVQHHRFGYLLEVPGVGELELELYAVRRRQQLERGPPAGGSPPHDAGG